MADIEPIPGSVFLSTRIERRKFLKRAANTLFYGVAAVSAGAVSLTTFLANPAEATGPCCGYSCCGPSPCCGTSCCNKDCCTASPLWGCKNNGGTCLGSDTRDYSGGCWSCPNGTSTIICCDCKTNNTNGCSNFTNRCICSGIHGTNPQQLREIQRFAPPRRLLRSGAAGGR